MKVLLCNVFHSSLFVGISEIKECMSKHQVLLLHASYQIVFESLSLAMIDTKCFQIMFKIWPDLTLGRTPLIFAKKMSHNNWRQIFILLVIENKMPVIFSMSVRYVSSKLRGF